MLKGVGYERVRIQATAPLWLKTVTLNSSSHCSLSSFHLALHSPCTDDSSSRAKVSLVFVILSLTRPPTHSITYTHILFNLLHQLCITTVSVYALRHCKLTLAYAWNQAKTPERHGTGIVSFQTEIWKRNARN